MTQTHSKRQRHVPVKGASNVYWSERKGGRVYEVRHPRNANGVRLYEVVGTRLDVAKSRAREVHGDATPRVASVGTTLGQVFTAWQSAREVRPRTAQTYDDVYRVHIADRLANVKVRDIDKQMIQTWLNGLRRKDGKDGELASGTKRLAWAVLQCILDHAVEIGALGSVPKLSRKRTPKAGAGRTRVLSQDEEQRLIAFCGAFKWMQPLIIVALHQALRLGEVCGLQWEDISFTGSTLTVRHSLGRDGTLGPTKGGHEDTIPLTDAARDVLLELRMDSDGTGFVFRNTLGGRRQLRDVQRAFAKAATRAGIDGVVFHSLRHTAISRAANHPGIALVQVRDFARHTDLAVTQGYVHKIDSAAATTALNEALAG